jgi:hypothetical protein
MPNTILGKVCITPKGELSAGKIYEQLDFVIHDGSSFVSLQNENQSQITDKTAWQTVAEAGKTGLKGDAGEAATLEVVETITGDYGTEASITEADGSTAQHRKLIITIPQRENDDALTAIEKQKAITDADAELLQKHRETDRLRWDKNEADHQQLNALLAQSRGIELDENAAVDIKDVSEGAGYVVPGTLGGIVRCEAVNVIVLVLEVASGTLYADGKEVWGSSGLLTVEPAKHDERVDSGQVITSSGMTKLVFVPYVQKA